jgi:iron complex transport system substrate-binding protein
MRTIDEITGAIIDASMQIHKDVGPGLYESVYETILERSLQKRGFKVERQKPGCFEYDGMMFDDAFRTDLLVDNVVVVELKSVEKLLPVHAKQLLTYVRLLELQVGLLINFGGPTLKEGIQRIVNNLRPENSSRFASKTEDDPEEPV